MIEVPRRKSAGIHVQTRHVLLGPLGLGLSSVVVAACGGPTASTAPASTASASPLLAPASIAPTPLGSAPGKPTPFAAGWLIFGIASFRARVFPRRAAVLMTVGGFVGALALIAPFQIPLALAVGWMGLWLVRSESPAAQRSSKHVAAIA
jgi:hypothetical protein